MRSVAPHPRNGHVAVVSQSRISLRMSSSSDMDLEEKDERQLGHLAEFLRGSSSGSSVDVGADDAPLFVATTD